MMKKIFAIAIGMIFSVSMMAGENKPITTLTPEGEPVVVTITETGVKLVKGDVTVYSTNMAANSLVKNGEEWLPAIASDESQMMIWSDAESGKTLRSLDYITATLMDWNNGYNTVVVKPITTLTPEGEPVVVTITETGVKLVKGDVTIFSTNKAANSLVKNGEEWLPAIASDESQMMVWRDAASGEPLRSLNYITAHATGWNNGYNTVIVKPITTLTPEGDEVVATITETGVKLVNGDVTVYSTNRAANSLVKKEGRWTAAIAKDKSQMMVWSDAETGEPLRTLPYVFACANGWNNGNMTVIAAK